MTIVAGEIKALISAARAAPGIVTRIAASEALKRRFDESIAEVHRDEIQVCFGVCKALVANALRCDPTDDQVDAFMTAAIGDAAFPHRAYRLLLEMRKSASRRRRAFLASVLFGLPFSRLPDDERDRVDMVVEQLIPADIDVLMRIADGAKVQALVSESSVRLVTDEYRRDSDFLPEATTDPSLVADQTALATLVSVNCVVLGDVLIGGELRHEGYLVKSVHPTPLGQAVIRAIRELHPGFEGVSDQR